MRILQDRLAVERHVRPVVNTSCAERTSFWAAGRKPVARLRDNSEMLVNLLPGASREVLRDTLRDLLYSASNLRSPSSQWQTRDWLTAYVNWTEEAARRLRGQVGQDEIHRLVFSDRRQLLLSKVGLLYPDLEGSGVNHLLAAELDDRVVAFTKAHDDLNLYIQRWSTSEVFVALDTNVYLHGKDEVQDIKFASLLDLVEPTTPVRLFVPMLVVDELDDQKQSGKKDVSGRARRTTRLLHKVLRSDPAKPQPLHLGDPSVIVELVPDPRGHVRLPHKDDEIVDRLAAVQMVAGREITLVTYDIGMALRAQLGGLQVRLAQEATPAT